MMNEKYTGIVKFYKDDKGYGFIKLENGREIFVHVRQLKHGLDRLETGQKVSFETTEARKGVVTTNVELIQESESIL